VYELAASDEVSAESDRVCNRSTLLEAGGDFDGIVSWRFAVDTT
jgi:hypothetical protein